jgi:uncharacterized membrane protein
MFFISRRPLTTHHAVEVSMLRYDAPHWHAVLNDLPAALLLVAVLFDLAAGASKRESLIWAGTWTLWAGVIGGWVAVIAGKLAEKALEHGEAIHALMESHERVAIMTMSVFTVILIWKMARRFVLPPQEQALTRALSIVGFIGLVWTGILGGRLMFNHAAGIPDKTLQTELQNRQAGHQHAEGAGMGVDSTKQPHVDPPGTPPHKH